MASEVKRSAIKINRGEEKSKIPITKSGIIAVTFAAIAAILIMCFCKFMVLWLRAMLATLAILISIVLGVVERQPGQSIFVYFMKKFTTKPDHRPYCKRGVYDVSVEEAKTDDSAKKIEGVFLLEEDDNMRKKEIRDDKSILIPGSAQDTIPFEKCYEKDDLTIFKVKDNLYSIVFSWSDINYIGLSKSARESKVDIYHELLNTLPEGVTYQELIVNQPIAGETQFEKLYLDPEKNPECENLIDDFNDNYLNYFVSKAEKSSSEHLTYMALSYEPINDKDDPVKTLETVYGDISKVLDELGSTTVPLTAEETFKLMHDIYYPYEEFRLPKDLYARGENIRDYIAPNGFRFKYNVIELGDDHYMKVMAMRLAYDITELTDTFISKLLDNPYRVCVSKIVTRIDKNEAMHQIRSDYGTATDKIGKRERENMRTGETGISYTSQSRVRNLKKQLDELSKSENELFRVNVYVSVSATSLQELNSITSYLKKKASSSQVSLSYLNGSQENGIHSIMPFAHDYLFESKFGYALYLLTEACSVLIPFSTRRFFEPNGIPLGNDAISKNAIAIDLTSGMNSNALIYGASGSGKSYLLKYLEFYRRMKYPYDCFISVDPDGELEELCEVIHGQRIKITPNSTTKINIFDIDEEYYDEDTQKGAVSLKSDYITTIISTMVKRDLSSIEESIVDRVVKTIYIPYMQSKKKSDLPILTDFYKQLLQQPENEAKKLALTLEKYVTNDYFYNGHTNVDVKNKYIVFDLKNVGENKSLPLQIVLEFIWMRVNQNRKLGLRTWVDTDEIQSLIVNANGEENKFSANYYGDFYRRVRKLEGIPTAVFQNFSKVWETNSIKTMIDNTNVHIICQQGVQDSEALAKHFNLTPEEVKYITSGVKGTGIIVINNKKIMYDMLLPRNKRAESSFHSIISTTLKEKK